MNTRSLLLGIAAGCAVMFLLDPPNGRRRRALLRDKATVAQRKTRDGLDAAARDLGNRAAGLAAVARSRWSSAEVDDARLVERVRAKLGRIASHPRAIDVSADSGCVLLSGPVLAAEAERVLAGVESVRGVREVVNALDLHATADGVPSLQGAGPMDESMANGAWGSPSTRALMAAGLVASVAMVAGGRRWRGTEANHGAM